MSRAGDRNRQAAQLVRLRHVRLQSASRALADARDAAAAAEAACRAAAGAASDADAHHVSAREALAADPAEAERRLAILDQALFRRSVAETKRDAARAEQDRAEGVEATQRRAMVIARARHDVLAERVGAIARSGRALDEERRQMDEEDVRRFR